MPAGVLFLVVGPSGAGKDTLMEGAREALAGDPGFVFAKRVITRPAEAGGEDHTAMTGEAFEKARAAGAFLVCWSAHGLCYGLAAELARDLAAGRNVVANVSRAAIAELAASHPNVKVIHVTAPPDVLARRLAKRGRETEADIAARLAREGAGIPAGLPVTELVSDATPEQGTRRFVAALTQNEAGPC